MSGEISTAIIKEGGLVLVSFLFGIGLMLLYDIFRIFRHIVKHGTFLLAIEDIFYWMAGAVGIFAMLYRENDGLLRWFVIGGIALGMLFENSRISPFVIRLSVKILRTWLRAAGKFFGLFTKPVKKNAKKAGSFFKKELKKAGKAIKIGLSRE